MINNNALEAIGFELRAILPEGTFFHLTDSVPLNYELYLEESKHTGRMAEKRLNDFKASRYCAKISLKQLGIEQFAVLINPNGSPSWPDGVIGSISHTRNLCVAAVMKINGIKSIGIDVETAKPIDLEILDLICSNKEIKRLKKQGDPMVLGKVMFSIKESIFKCFHPAFGEWLNFKDVDLKLDLVNNQYQLNFLEKVNPTLKNCNVAGKWFLGNKFILSSCWI